MRLDYRAWVLAPPRTPRAERQDVSGEVATTAAGVAVAVPVYYLDR